MPPVVAISLSSHLGRPALRRKKLEGGFSLAELMIASLVLMTGLTAVMSMLLFALSTNYTSRIESAALRLSQQRIEELKALPIDDSRLAGPGNSVDPEFNIDFIASPISEYFSNSELVLNKTKNTFIGFETRWNVTTTGQKKLITVATRNTAGIPFKLKPVNLRVVRAP